MPYEHDAPAPAPARRAWRPPAFLRWTVASAVVAAVLLVPVVVMGLWREQGAWPWALLAVFVVSRPLGWLLWTRRRA